MSAMLPKPFTRAGLCALSAGALITLGARSSHAEQFVLFDETFTMTWEDAINSSPSKSHHYIKSNSGLNAMRPANWTSPVNYRDGTVHIYLEVLDKPEGGQKQGWALCYVGGGGYGCPYTPYYTEKGVYERDVDMHAFYNNTAIGWTQGISEIDLIYTINDSGSGHVHYFPDLKDMTTPTTVRIAMVQVSEGSVYDPSVLPNTGGSMGGSGGMGGASGASAGGGAGGTAGAASGGSSGGTAGASGGTPTQAGAGNTAGIPSAGSGGAPTVAGASSGAGSAAMAPSSGDTSEAAGCSLGGSSGASGTTGAHWLLLAALGLLRRRR
jgi:hypothetical protein